MLKKTIDISAIKKGFDTIAPKHIGCELFGVPVSIQQRMSLSERQDFIKSVVDSATDSGAPYVCFDYAFNYCLLHFLTDIDLSEIEQEDIDEMLTSSDILVFFESATHCDPYELREICRAELDKRLRRINDPIERLVDEITDALRRFAPEGMDLDKALKDLDEYMKSLKQSDVAPLMKTTSRPRKKTAR